MPTGMSTLAKVGLVGAAVVVAAGLALYVKKVVEVASQGVEEEKGTDESSDTAKSSVPEAAPGRTILLSTLINILNDAHQGTQQLAMALAQRGFDSATEEEQHTLVQDFNTRAVKILDIACQRRGCVTREEFEAALEAHRDNKRVQQLVEYREQLIEAINSNDATKLPNVPDDVTVDQVLEKLKVFSRHVEANLRSAVEEAKESGLEGDALAQEITRIVLKNSKDAQARAVEEMGMTHLMFQAWVKKFKDDPQVEAVFLELNETNNRIMSAVPTVESDQQ